MEGGRQDVRGDWNSPALNDGILKAALLLINWSSSTLAELKHIFIVLYGHQDSLRRGSLPLQNLSLTPFLKTPALERIHGL